MLSESRVHTTIPVTDIGRARVFYGTTLGFPVRLETPVAQNPAGRSAWFKDPEGNILGLIEFVD